MLDADISSCLLFLWALSSAGMLKLALNNIGFSAGTRAGEVGVSDSRRSVEALATAAAGVSSVFSKAEVRFRGEVDKSRALAINRFYDATPMFLKFGRLTSLIGSSRYLKKVERPGQPVRWTTISYEEWRKEHPNLGKPRMGVLDLFATRLQVGHCSGSVSASSSSSPGSFDVQSAQCNFQEFHTPPPVIKSGTASCIYSAVDATSPSFSLASLSGWAAHDADRVCILNDCPDNARSNLRCKKATAEELPGNMLYDMFCGCTAHKLHNSTVKVSGESKLVGHVHACSFVMSLASRRQQLQEALEEVVSIELKSIPGQAPPECREWSREVLKHTALARTELVRAAVDEDGIAPPGRNMKTEQVVVPQLLEFLNGDIRSDQIEHYCRGCCQDEHGVTTRESQVNAGPACDPICFPPFPLPPFPLPSPPQHLPFDFSFAPTSSPDACKLKPTATGSRLVAGQTKQTYAPPREQE